MYFSKARKIFTALTVACLFFISTPFNASAQDFSDDELQRFANAVTQVMDIQQQSQMQMIQIIEDNDMSVERFNELMMESQQAPGEEIDAPAEEVATFEEISTEIMQIQDDMEDVITEAIEDQNMTLDEYEAILAAYQQDPELQQRIQQMLQ